MKVSLQPVKNFIPWTKKPVLALHRHFKKGIRWLFENPLKKADLKDPTIISLQTCGRKGKEVLSRYNLTDGTLS